MTKWPKLPHIKKGGASLLCDGRIFATIDAGHEIEAMRYSAHPANKPRAFKRKKPTDEDGK